MSTTKNGVLTMLMLACLCLIQAVQAESSIAIDSAWIREAPPATSVLAAYMTVKNDSDTDQQITGMESPDFRSAEIHRTVVKDGVARMLPVDALTVAAGASIRFEPGGLHVMLFDPQRPLHEGDSARLIVHMASGVTIATQAMVVRETGDDAAHDHSHHHH